jgi:hypothetical protein
LRYFRPPLPDIAAADAALMHDAPRFHAVAQMPAGCIERAFASPRRRYFRCRRLIFSRSPLPLPIDDC